MKLKDMLVRVRSEKRLTQDDVAQMAGVTPGAISGWERGAKPRRAAIIRLEKKLGLSQNEITSCYEKTFGASSKELGVSKTQLPSQSENASDPDLILGEILERLANIEELQNHHTEGLDIVMRYGDEIIKALKQVLAGQAELRKKYDVLEKQLQKPTGIRPEFQARVDRMLNTKAQKNAPRKAV